jgi:hypothetical protein
MYLFLVYLIDKNMAKRRDVDMPDWKWESDDSLNVSLLVPVSKI